MLFTWDSEKAEQNIRKHGVSFELAQTVFDDPLQLSVPDAKLHNEERWVTIGRSAGMKTLVVVHTHRMIEDNREITRIISARKATKKEVRQYEEGI